MPTIYDIAGNMRSLGYAALQYTDATYRYHCWALPGTARSTPAWKVVRQRLDGNESIPAGVAGFGHPATNLAAVSGLTYTLGG